MRDNKTSQPAHEYDAKVEKTIPLYSLLHEQTLSLIEAAAPQPGAWLDAGCGTGALVSKARLRFPETRFTLADPSDAMLDIAKAKFAAEESAHWDYLRSGTEALECQAGSFDVITAVLSHHYLDLGARGTATANCFRMLKTGGIYVTFESIRPQTETGLQIGLERWRQAQLKAGKSPDEVSRHINRYGIEFLPISINSHIDLLRNTGFASVEVFWISFMQAGFYAVK